MSTPEVSKESDLIDLENDDNLFNDNSNLNNTNIEESTLKSKENVEDKDDIKNNKFTEILLKQDELINKIEELNLKLSNNINTSSNLIDSKNNSNLGEIIFEFINPIDGSSQKEIIQLKDNIPSQIDQIIKNEIENKHITNNNKNHAKNSKIIDNYNSCPFLSLLFESDYEYDSIEFALELVLKYFIFFLFFIIFFKFISRIFVL